MRSSLKYRFNGIYEQKKTTNLHYTRRFHCIYSVILHWGRRGTPLFHVVVFALCHRRIAIRTSLCRADRFLLFLLFQLLVAGSNFIAIGGDVRLLERRKEKSIYLRPPENPPNISPHMAAGVLILRLQRKNESNPSHGVTLYGNIGSSSDIAA